ncbi:MAG TPA: diguanylate cyclase [Solirubrobacteraceae bacterium]
MAARDSHASAQGPQQGEIQPLPPAALLARLDEEISRAERHGTNLSCLLVMIDNLEEMAREHGSDLPEQTLAYVAAAIRRELRRFDRIGRPSAGELLIVLPGADGPLGEIVAKRVLGRMRTIKLESDGARRPLEVSLGLAAWNSEMVTEDLLERSRAAASRRNGEDPAHSADGDRRAAKRPPAERAARRQMHAPSPAARAAPS